MKRRVAVTQRPNKGGRGHESGFTLIELLVVIVILGVLSAVVVFAVRGTGDKGSEAARITDAKTLRTAEEAFCAKVGRYGDMEELTGQKQVNGETYKFLSEKSTLHKPVLGGGGPCKAAGVESQSAFRIGEPKVDRLRYTGGSFGYPSPFGSTPGPGFFHGTYLVFDPLVWLESDGTVVPALASSFVSSADGKEWTFTLRQGAKWHDGTPVTVDDVVFTFNYFKTGPASTIGAFQARGNLANVTSVEPGPAPNTVLWKLPAPYAPFMERIVRMLTIIPKHIWQGVTGDLRTYRGPNKEELIGSGPYKPVDIDSTGGNYRFVANQDYMFGPAHIREFQLINVGTNTVLALEQGKIDAAQLSDPPVDQSRLNAMVAKGKVKLENHGDTAHQVYFNMTRGAPYTDVRFRRALAYGINRGDIVTRVLQGQAKLQGYGVLPVDHPFFASGLPTYDFNVTTANQLLDDAGMSARDAEGFRLKPDGTSFRPGFLYENRFQGMATVVLENLLALGIKTATPQAVNSSRTQTTAGNYDIAIVQSGGVQGDPENIADRFPAAIGTPNGVVDRVFGYDTPRLRQLLTEQVNTIDRATRMTQFAEVQSILASDVPMVPVYVTNRYLMFDPNVFSGYYYINRCSPCGETFNTRLYVTGKKPGEAGWQGVEP